MVVFNWLHLTDLHVGMQGSQHLWPGVRYRFLEDLKRTIHNEKIGAIDLVLFTGDFVQSGKAEEFQRLDEILYELWKEFHKINNSKPKLVAVPGNHDLLRPANESDNPNPALETLMYLWDYSDSKAKRAFWERRESPQRRIVNEAFRNYVEWWQNSSVPKPDTYSDGELPGDFSATIEKGKAKLGIVGLNSSFLQLIGGNRHRSLDLDQRQFNKVCADYGDEWVDEHSVCLLLTHHPPDWLTTEGEGRLMEIHDPPYRFALHLFGHMHENRWVSISYGGGGARQQIQGSSLFGMETWGGRKEQKRTHGYSIGQLKIDGKDAKIQIWPRIGQQYGGGGWDLVRDQAAFRHFAPTSDAIEPIPVTLLPNNDGSLYTERRLWSPGPDIPADGNRDPRKFQEINSAIDPILIARLDTLQQKLSRIPSWLESELETLEPNQETQKMLKTQLRNRVNGSVSAQLGALDLIYHRLKQLSPGKEEDLQEVWRDYIGINSESQKIFLECVDLIGGLAIRDKQLDQRICWIADQLVMQCAVDHTFTADLMSLTVLAQQEALHKSMARILRLRFPEWTVWSLPFIAHEFGHVLIEDHPELEDFAKSQVKIWNKRRRGSVARQQNEYYLSEVIADTFATYVVGPAYACAAVSLRLNPSIMNSEEMRLADATRADVILGVLRWMNDNSSDTGGQPLKPYEDIIAWLERQWDHALRRAEPSSTLSKKQETINKTINTLVKSTLKDTVEKLQAIFYYGRYPSTGSNGLEVARTWAQLWSGQLAAKERLSIPQTFPSSSLRDSLNAAWICRIDRESSDIDLIADAAYRLCERIAGRVGSGHDPGSGMHEAGVSPPPGRPPAPIGQ